MNHTFEVHIYAYRWVVTHPFSQQIVNDLFIFQSLYIIMDKYHVGNLNEKQITCSIQTDCVMSASILLEGDVICSSDKKLVNIINELYQVIN